MNKFVTILAKQVKKIIATPKVRDQIISFNCAVKQKSAEKRLQRYPFLNLRFRTAGNAMHYEAGDVKVTIYLQQSNTLMEAMGHVAAMAIAAPDESGNLIPNVADVFLDERMACAPEHIRAAVIAHEAAHVIRGDIYRDVAKLDESQIIEAEIAADVYSASIGCDMAAALEWMSAIYRGNMTQQMIRIMDIRIDALKYRKNLLIVPKANAA